MVVQLRPEMEKFVEAQVRAGHYASADEAVEAGLARLMLDPGPDVLDEQDVAEINAALDQMRRGDVLPSTEVRRRLMGALSR